MEDVLEIPIPGFSRFEDLDLDHWVTLRTEADQDRRITIFADRHKIGAWAMVQATGKKPKLAVEDVIRVARSANIAVADDSAVKNLVKSFQSSPKEAHEAALLAKGRPPKDGTDSITQWSTDSPLDEGDEDGEGLISGNSRRYVLVKKGDLIFEVTPPVHGEQGMDIFGKPVPCKDGEWKRLLAGDFTTSNQSQTHVEADHDGYLDVRDGRVNVNPTVVVVDVNHKTDNIEFDGEVWVQGEVQADYHVICNKLRARTINRGHVKVSGHLDIEENLFGEPGLASECEGNVSLNKSRNAELLVDGDVNARDECINCYFQVGGKFDGGKTVWVGGRLNAIEGIVLAEVGNGEGSTQTVGVEVEALNIPALIPARRDVQSAKSDIDKISTRLGPLLSNATAMAALKPAQKAAVQKLKATLEGKEFGLDVAGGQLKNALKPFEKRAKYSVKVRRRIWPGTTIVFGESSLAITEAIDGPCEVVLQGDEIVVKDLRQSTTNAEEE